MPDGFVHEAVVRLDPGSDDRAPGAAITLALCGDLRHEPPCPLAPHHTAVETGDDGSHLRVVFACDAGAEADVRSLIDAALRQEVFHDEDGNVSRWRLIGSHAGRLRDEEVAHARRLSGG